LFQACTQSLGARLLGCEALCVGGRPLVRAPLGAGAFGLGVDAMDEPIAKARERLLDAADVDDVGAGPQDHEGCLTGPAGGVDAPPHFGHSLLQPHEDRLTDEEVTDVEFGHLGDRRNRRDRLVVDPVAGVHFEAK
jgi:hypothetical protein